MFCYQAKLFTYSWVSLHHFPVNLSGAQLTQLYCIDVYAVRNAVSKLYEIAHICLQT